MAVASKPHAVCIPLPAQSHVACMMKLAKLLHYKGFHITFVNTELNHNQILKARGKDSLDGLPDFQFKTIADAPRPDESKSYDFNSSIKYFKENAPAPFVDLIENLNQEAGVPPVTCVVADGFMMFTILAAEQLGLPTVLYWPFAASTFLTFLHMPLLAEKGLTPFKDESYYTNGHLDTIIDFIPGLKDIRLKDLLTLVRIMDPNDVSFTFSMDIMEFSKRATACILHTYEALEIVELDALSKMLQQVVTVGPIDKLLRRHEEEIGGTTKSLEINTWKEDPGCIAWLDSKEPGSVVYVNFGSLGTITKDNLIEMGWGLANSKCHFLWVIRPDILAGESAVLPPEFYEDIKERGLISGWCPQEQVLNHPSLGGFLTHCGWTSVIESLSSGVPMICWPFFGDHVTNCHYICSKWKAGLEIGEVTRNRVAELVRRMIVEEEGVKLKKKAMEWKRLAAEATSPHGTSSSTVDSLVNKIKAL